MHASRVARVVAIDAKACAEFFFFPERCQICDDNAVRTIFIKSGCQSYKTEAILNVDFEIVFLLCVQQPLATLLMEPAYAISYRIEDRGEEEG